MTFKRISLLVGVIGLAAAILFWVRQTGKSAPHPTGAAQPGSASAQPTPPARPPGPQAAAPGKAAPGPTIDVSHPSADEATLRRQIHALHLRAAEGDRRADAVLDEWQRQGHGTEQFYINVPKMEKLAAERKDPELFGQLGMALLRGDGGLDPDLKRGLALLDKAAEDGNNHATLNLGLIYHLGKEVPALGVDQEKARHYFKLLAERGDPRGYLELGWIYWEHDKNLRQAAEAFEQAGLQGSREGSRHAGKILRLIGSDEEKRRGLALIESAANFNHVVASYEAGEIYLDGSSDTPADLTKALFYFNLVLNGYELGRQQMLLKMFYPDSSAAPEAGLTPELSAARQQKLREIEARRATDPAAAAFLAHLEAMQKNPAAAAAK